MNAELLNDILSKIKVESSDLAKENHTKLIVKAMEAVEGVSRGNLSGSEKKQYATQAVLDIYQRNLSSTVGVSTDDISSAIETIVQISKGQFNLQKTVGVVAKIGLKIAKSCCKKK